MAQRLQLEGLNSQDDEQELKGDDTIEDTDIYIESNCWSGITKIKKLESKGSQNERKSKQSASSSELVAGSFSDLNPAEIDGKIDEYLLRAEDGTYSCGICGKAGDNARNQKQNMRNHVETHMEGLSFSCQSCEKKGVKKTFRFRTAFARHKSRYHRS